MRDASVTRRSLRVRWTAALAAILVSTQSVAVFAQTDEERAGARAAATQGAKAFEEGRYADAIDLFTRAQSLVKAPTHLLYLARSQEKLGQLVAARESYLKIKREQLADDAPQAFKDAQQSAMTELAALEPRLPYIKVVVEGAGSKPYTVTMDGVQMASALVGVPIPADPGEHKFQATAEGLQSELATLTVKEGTKDTIALKLVDAPGAGAAAPVAAPTGAPETTSDSNAPPTQDTTKGGGPNGMKIGAYAALGVGVVGLGLGTVFALKASSKRKEADDLCNLPGGKCPADKKSEIDTLDSDADSAAGLSVAGFVVGGLGVAAGVTLWVISSRESNESARAPAVTPWVGYKSAGVFGRF